MKVSIITAILNSHEIVRRQYLYYSNMNLSDDIEVIWIDDGSDTPIRFLYNKGSKIDICENANFNLSIYETHDKKPWTQPKARNIGARKAKGDYLICTDIDHIVSPAVIQAAMNPIADVIRLRRQAGVLDENGNFTQDKETLREWGLKDRYFTRDLWLPPHGNSYIFKRELYLALGGVDERYCGTGRYPNREEIRLKRKLKEVMGRDGATLVDDDRRPVFYMMPNGKYSGDYDDNPFGLFHTLSRNRNIGRLTNKEKWKIRRQSL
jgi:predicted glycosyltransferase involved in capsule biosynthesis